MPFGTNCYIVADEETNEAMVIDPAINGREIINKIESMGVDIKLIVLTHGHPDHIGALSEIKEYTAAPVAIHPEDAMYIEGGSGGGFGFSRQEPVKPDKLLNGGDSVDIGNLHFGSNAPGWLEKKYPGSLDGKTHFVRYDIDNPHVVGVVRKVISLVAPRLVGKRQVFLPCVWQ